MTLTVAKFIFVIGIIIAALVFAFSAEAHKRMTITTYKVRPVRAAVERSMLFDPTPIADRHQRLFK